MKKNASYMGVPHEWSDAHWPRRMRVRCFLARPSFSRELLPTYTLLAQVGHFLREMKIFDTVHTHVALCVQQF